MKIARQRASSLITTLLVLVVLSTIVVAFMQSMSVERMTARSSKNLLQAELTAKAGASAAKAQVLRLFSKYPDSVTSWQPVVNGLNTEGTVFYFRGQNLAPTSLSPLNLPVATNGAAFNPTPGTPTAVQIYAWPLISGAVPAVGSVAGLTNPLANAFLTNAFPNAFTVANSMDFNANNWIGTAPGQLKKALRAQWVYVTNSEGVTNARYSYWVEDESFKVNVITASNVVRGGASLGIDAREIPLQGVLATAAGLASPDSAASEIVGLRNRFGGTNIPTFNTISQVFNLAGTNAVGEQLKFISTEYSSGLNISRGGWKRVNINNVFDASFTNSMQLNRFMATVTNPSASPLFGQRFYRSSASAAALNVTNQVTLTNSMVYLNKIAANVKDYLDTDYQPTLINLDFTVRENAEPTEALEPVGGGTSGPNPVIAFGKENVPMLQEYVIQGRLLSMVPAGWSNSNPGSANFECSIDHYFEFYNMGTKDISADDLGTDPFLLVYNQMAGSSSLSPAIPEGRPFKVYLKDIPNLVFRAGKTTVITTDPTPNTTLLSTGAAVFIAPVKDDVRLFKGRTTDSYSNNVYDSANNVVFRNSFRVRFQPRSNTYNDYETCMLLGNSEGIIESLPTLPIVRSSSYAMDLVADRPAKINSNVYFTRGGSLLGNNATSTTTLSPSLGDPRSLNEQLTLTIFGSSPSDELTRFFWSNLDDNAVPANSTMGALNKNFVRPANWPDYTSDAGTGSADAPMVIANTQMKTIGELGHIYDPARLVSTSYRAGGRTLHVGQPEAFASTNVSGMWDGATDSASRTWAAWRLADFFDVSTNNVSPGLININGVRKDNGLALKAALKGYAYQSGDNSDPSLKGITLTDTQINALVTAMTNRLANSNPFWERGEFSEIGLFQNGTALSGMNMAQVPDRGREELSRRMMNLVTTKGNTFTAYAVGQAISVGSGGKIKILATARSKQTFQVMPHGIDAQVDTFDPASPTDLKTRFEPLTNYFLKSVWNSQE